MEHLEEAGIHSGDSTCFIPPQNITKEMLDKITEQTKIIGIGLNIVGCFNIQFAIQGEDLYVLEVNPRSSRTVPFVAKSSGLPLARIAANITIGIPLSKQEIPRRTSGNVCVKAPVFPFIKLRGLDPAPGPEMNSTGEVYGSHENADVAYLKARLATEVPVAKDGGVYLTVRDQDKTNLLPSARKLHELLQIVYTRTADKLENITFQCKLFTEFGKVNIPRPRFDATGQDIFHSKCSNNIVVQ